MPVPSRATKRGALDGVQQPMYEPVRWVPRFLGGCCRVGAQLLGLFWLLFGCAPREDALGEDPLADLPTAPVALVGELRLDVAARLELGVPGPGDQAEVPLHLVQAATFLEHGGIAVLTEGTKSVLIIDSLGQVSGDLGQGGEGPGEFGLPRTISEIAGNRIQVWDMGLARITTFGPGDAVATLPVGRPDLPGFSPRGSAFRPHTVQRMGPHGFVVQHLRASARRPRGPSADSALVTVLDTLGNQIASAGVFPRTEWFGGESGAIVAPMGQRELYLGTTSNAFYAGTGVESWLVEFNPRGIPVRRLTLPIERDPLTRERLEADRRRFLARMASEQLRQAIAPTYDEGVALADSLLAFTDLRAASDGSLWVGLHEISNVPRLWLRVDPLDETARMLELDVPAIVLDASTEAVVLLARDEMDRERIRVHRFEQR